MKKILILILIIAVLAALWSTQKKGNDQLSAVNDFVNNTQSVEQKTYSTAEVAAHNQTNDCWVIVDGKVVNATTFISIHPGGAEKISRVCGTDITERYKRESAHLQTIADAVVNKLTIGTVTQ